jgi:lysophospholipase L1-like esterase
LGAVGPVLVALGLLAGIEGALRVAGFELKFSSGQDPRPNMLPLFKPATTKGGAVMRRNDATDVEFLREKPRNGFRVFVVGESSVFGFPWGPSYSLTQFLQQALAATMPERVVEVVNCGIMGIASWHARRIVEEEVVRYAPDVVIIYTGHNDWGVAGPEVASRVVRILSPLRVFQLAVLVNTSWQRWWNGPIDVNQLHAPNQAYGYAHDRARGLNTLRAADRRWIVTRFSENIRAMIASARAAGAKVLVASLGQNLRDFPPGTSRHRPDLDAAARSRWQSAMEDADRRSAAGDCRGAIAALDSAQTIDARPALAQYLRGHCLDSLGQFDGARAAYIAANDLDEIPLGAPLQFNTVLKDIAAETGVQFVDVLGALERDSPHDLVGGEYFFDHLHPSVAGHAAIARVLAGALGANGVVVPEATVAATASKPEVEKGIHAANVLLYMTLGWYDAALDELEQGARTFPDFVKLRPAVEAARDKDTVPARLDFPNALD